MDMDQGTAGSSAEDSEMSCPNCGFATAADAKLTVKILGMSLNGGRSDIESIGNLLIRESVAQQVQNLDFSIRQRLDQVLAMQACVRHTFTCN